MTEKRLRRFDGAYRWFQIAAAPVQDGQANLIPWCGINTDIDDLKCSEQRFRQDAADLRTITGAIRDRVLLDMAPGCPERLDSDFPKWIWNWPRHSRPDLLAALTQASGRVHFPQRPSNITQFLAEIGPGKLAQTSVS